MEKLFFILITLIFVSCNYKPKEAISVSDFCFIIEDYDKTICLDEPFDTLHPVYYIDKNYFEMRERKFNGLKMYIMMVVEVDLDSRYVTFSNPNYSVEVKFEDDRELPILQSIYYLIIRREHLSDSKLVMYSDGTKEPMPSDLSDEDSHEYEQYIEEP